MTSKAFHALSAHKKRQNFLHESARSHVDRDHVMDLSMEDVTIPEQCYATDKSYSAERYINHLRAKQANARKCKSNLKS